MSIVNTEIKKKNGLKSI